MNPPSGLVDRALALEPSRRSSSGPCGSLPLNGERRAPCCQLHRPRGSRGRAALPNLEDKIARDHPELVDHLEAVLETVAKPDHIEADALSDRTRFYRRGVGPSRWLMAVVSYEQQPARIITALASRKDPKRWKP
jgi:hypothetical protein